MIHRRCYSRSVRMLLCCFVFAQTVIAQIDTPVVAPQKDVGDIYRRAAASRIVVVGTVLRSEGVGSRPSESDKDNLLGPVPEEGKAIVSLPTLSGSLYTVQVEETLCRQEEFSGVRVPGDQLIVGPEKAVYVFVPRSEPMFVNGHRQEFLLQGGRYLLFLVEPTPEKQEEWTKSFKLDPKRVYYRGEELSRGVIPLAKSTPENPLQGKPPVLEKVTRLCDALRPKNVPDKLAALKKLAASGDPILVKEAKAAAVALLKRAN